MFAYDLAKASHRTQKREGGDRYFEHIRSTALILMDECGIQDPDVLSAALLHDVIEDSTVFGSKNNNTYSTRVKEAQYRVGKAFGDDAAEMVIALSKPAVDGMEIRNDDEAMKIYLENLSRASPETLLVKMADRLHNLRTQFDTSPEKQRRKITETKEKYLPIFEQALERYPNEARYLMDQMHQQIQTIETALAHSSSA